MVGGHNIIRVDKRMLEAACMAAEGQTVADIAKHFGVHQTTVRAWLKNEEVQAEIIACIRADIAPTVAKAFNVVKKQLDSAAAKGFLAQNAAREVLGRYGAPILEEGNKELKVTFVNGTVPLGMPDDPEDE